VPPTEKRIYPQKARTQTAGAASSAKKRKGRAIDVWAGNNLGNGTDCRSGIEERGKRGFAGGGKGGGIDGTQGDLQTTSNRCVFQK